MPLFTSFEGQRVPQHAQAFFIKMKKKIFKMAHPNSLLSSWGCVVSRHLILIF